MDLGLLCSFARFENWDRLPLFDGESNSEEEMKERPPVERSKIIISIDKAKISQEKTPDFGFSKTGYEF